MPDSPAGAGVPAPDRLSYYERPDRPLGVLDFTILDYHVYCAWEQQDEDAAPTSLCDRADLGTFWLRCREYRSKVRGRVE